jgi:hypothetical protein
MTTNNTTAITHTAAYDAAMIVAVCPMTLVSSDH